MKWNTIGQVSKKPNAIWRNQDAKIILENTEQAKGNELERKGTWPKGIEYLKTI